MNKPILITVVVIAALLLGVFYFFSNNLPQKSNSNTTTITSTLSPTPKSAEQSYTATFEIYTNGTKRIFTDSRYHNLNDSVFLTAESPTTIQIKDENTTWKYFFDTLPMELTKECLTTGTKQIFCSNEKQKLRFYVNGIENENILDSIIRPNDHLKIEYK